MKRQAPRKDPVDLSEVIREVLALTRQELHLRYSLLTEREREVMGLVVAGRLNKQIAAELDVSEVTVKVHRGQVMRKMRARSLPELVRMADRLGKQISS
jgi:FixJ family two-component response regulator